MELLFRKYFWTVNLAFLALAAWLVARTGNTFVAAALQPSVTATEGSTATGDLPPPTRAGAVSMSPEQAARILGVELPSAVVASVVEAPPTDPNAEPVKSSLRATLIGTMVANRAEWSLATLRDDGNQAVGVFMPGEPFMTATVTEVERLRVILLNEGRREYIAVKDDGKPAAPPPPPVATGITTESSEDGITKIDENTMEITRSKIDEQLANLSQLSTQARIVPSFKDGVANGFKLFSIRPGSVYAQIGIQNGDVIKRINGYELNSPDKALEVYGKLKESAKIEIEVERRGSPLKKTYNIR